LRRACRLNQEACVHKVLLLGSGKIGRMIARLWASSGDYEVCVADADAASLKRLQDAVQVQTMTLDASRPEALRAALQGRDSVVSALSFHFNPAVAEAALSTGASYFDLTEDVETTRRVRRIAQGAQPGQIFMPQCGLAPGFISIIAHHLTRSFSELENVRLRVGALPQYPTDALKYNLTWSTDGLINEYCNPCEAIHEGRRVETLPLEGCEEFSLDGVRYEAFNTSGGLGTLCDTLEGKVRELNYRTIRYPGHRDLMKFLVNDLRLGQRREVLKDILEHAVPITFQDVVVVFCTVTGRRNGQLVQISDARKIYRQTLDGEDWSAIQVTTAASLCAAVDLFVAGRLPSQGFVRQEEIALDDFLANRFGAWYAAPRATVLDGAGPSS
jgi:saccharopine dehydrogenase-like NADP-dependent oxidoreductase